MNDFRKDVVTPILKQYDYRISILLQRKARPSTPPREGLYGDWLARAERGERFIYHVGHLAFDREKDANTDRLAKVAAKDADLGYVALVQQRVGKNSFKYIAERLAKGTETRAAA